MALTKDGLELPDPTPKSMSMHFTKPPTLAEMVDRISREQVNKRMLIERFNVDETPEEAEDFGPEDDDIRTDYENAADALPIVEVRRRLTEALQQQNPGRLSVLMQHFKHLFTPRDLKAIARVAAARYVKVDDKPASKADDKPKGGE